jgi:hypothetical protein
VATVGVTHLELLKATYTLRLFIEQGPRIHENMNALGAAIMKRIKQLVDNEARDAVTGIGGIVFFKPLSTTKLSWRSALRYRILPPFDMDIASVPSVFRRCATTNDIPHIGFCIVCGEREQHGALTRCETCPNAYHDTCNEKCPDCEYDV